MPTLPTRSRAAIVVAIAGITASLLTGCNPVDLVNQGVEDAIEGATGGDVSLGDLPEGFPTSIPLIEGDVSGGAGGGSTGADGWFVVITSSASDPMAEAASALESAGFTEETSVSGGQLGARAYSNDEYLVLIAGDGKAVSYTVTPNQQ